MIADLERADALGRLRRGCPPCDRRAVPERKPGTELLLVSSSGGVLLDVLALRPWWHDQPHRWACVSAADSIELLAGEVVRWQPELRPASIAGARDAIKAAFAAWRLLRHDQVGLVISAGSGIAVPWFLAAALRGIPRVWLETFNVLGRPGLASRLCSSLSSVVLVQHRHLVSKHRRVIYVGELY